MMTIKEFASLCSCNTQTLRYYDKISLLKPVKVDPWSGYRYYEKAQAIDFVKIKNLQAADFTIEEIKTLLTLPDQQVYEAFDRKIAEQSEKLKRIREIQKSYLAEKNNMEKLVQNVADYLLHAVSDYDVLREFGLSPEAGSNLVANLKDYFERIMRQRLPAEPEVSMILNDQVIRGADRIADAFAALKDSGYEDTVLLGDEFVQEDEGFTRENSEILWECDGWNYVYEFLDQIPPMAPGYDYCFHFKLTEEKYQEKLEFPMFMIAAMLPKIDGGDTALGCIINKSDDGKNHCALLRRK